MIGPPVTWNILGYSLFCERREKWRVVSRKFQKKKLWPLIKRAFFFYPSDLVNTKTGSVKSGGYIARHFASRLYPPLLTPPLRGIVVYYHYYSGRYKRRTGSPWIGPDPVRPEVIQSDFSTCLYYSLISLVYYLISD